MESVLSVPDFLLRREDDFSWHRDDTVVLPASAYEEKVFNRMLDLERKRSERSNRPFMLMLAHFDGELASGTSISSKVFSCLESCKRETDFIGWYKAGEVIGIIFTEIAASISFALPASIMDRISTALSSNFKPGEIANFEISLNLFPDCQDTAVHRLI
jgi:hypothetical protein